MASKIDTKAEYPDFLDEYNDDIENPYGGLFGNAVQVQLVEKIIADPSLVYRPRDFKEMLGVSPNSIKKSINKLVDLKLLIDITKDKYRPEYTVNTDSKQLLALTLLAYAVLDDRDGTNLMNRHISEYCDKILSTEQTSITYYDAINESNTFAYKIEMVPHRNGKIKGAMA